MKNENKYIDETNFSEVIYELRKKHNLTQKQLADLINISDKTISNWENGTTIPDLINIKRICTALNISPSKIIFSKVTIKDRVNNINNKLLKICNYILKNVFIIFFVIAFILLLIFFINNYNSVAVYDFKYDSENIQFDYGYLINTKNVNILMINNITLDSDIEYKDLLLELYVYHKGDKRVIYSSDTINDIYLEEYIKYEEILDKDTINSMKNNLYLDIIVKDKDNKEKVYSSIIYLHKAFISNKLTYKRYQKENNYDNDYLSFLSGEKINFKTNNINLEKFNDYNNISILKSVVNKPKSFEDLGYSYDKESDSYIKYDEYGGKFTYNLKLKQMQYESSILIMVFNVEQENIFIKYSLNGNHNVCIFYFNKINKCNFDVINKIDYFIGEYHEISQIL